ncbi:uncharacterized protein LOC115834257 [Nomascus leucogenys]|uniref:uncharacterized protein LOC115834257 n=1 Tax=Nomascus leucogenys TaxID=61853 RepID=UPI00122D6A04|nr:uncharacterized protein LOC115834257 [Nomascus leucogenys]
MAARAGAERLVQPRCPAAPPGGRRPPLPGRATPPPETATPAPAPQASPTSRSAPAPAGLPPGALCARLPRPARAGLGAPDKALRASRCSRAKVPRRAWTVWGGPGPAGQDPLLLLQALQTLWSTRERQQLREEAWRGFAALDDPLAGLLDMLESCRGRRGEGPSLEAWISHQLQCWLQAQPRPSPAQHSLRLKQLQARAVRVLTESSPSLVAPLASIFQLQDADRSCLLVHVHRLHHEGRFREVSGPRGRPMGKRLLGQWGKDVPGSGTPLWGAVWGFWSTWRTFAESPGRLPFVGEFASWVLGAD